MPSARAVLWGSLAVSLATIALAGLPGVGLRAPAAVAAAVERSATGAGERRVSIFYTAEVHGTLEPCGCTSDPLGDIARYAALVRSAREQGAATLLVDAGGLLYGEGGVSPKERPADDLRAKFLATELTNLGLRGAGLGETDLIGGLGLVQPKRLASNLGGAAVIEPARIETVGGVKIGLVGVADPALASTLGVAGEEPTKAASRDVERLRREGAEIVVVLAPVDRSIARRVARDAGADFVVAGRQVGKGSTRAEKVGAAFLVSPADELQRVGRIDLVLRHGGGALVDAGGAEANQARMAELDAAIKRLDDDLARWSGSSGDTAFVASRRAQRGEMAAERARLALPFTPPSTGNYFTNRLIALNRELGRDGMMGAAMKRLDAKIAAVNLKHALPPPPPEPGRAFYVGMNKCVTCHKSAAAFWKTTVHAEAWQTLVAAGKQADYKCVACHVTGYGQVGGTSLGHSKGLSDVQCETCHGPGSIHVAEKGLEEPSSVHRDTPETTCLGCHNEHHSDTFQYAAYLRDVLGAGHGQSARAKLGVGPTGHELRSAAQNRAHTAAADQATKL
ncbi:MAG TPA: multiheme c-type cytochrome [Polyangia bacterium]|nr:multiheme c-type cytochrome [Polyangia bacterium]